MVAGIQLYRISSWVHLFCLEPLVVQFEHYVDACMFLKKMFLMGNFTTHGQWEHQEQMRGCLEGCIRVPKNMRLEERSWGQGRMDLSFEGG